jgi:hypothetical protein
MRSARILGIGLLLLLPIVVASVSFTQENSDFQTREQNFREYVTLLRADVKTERRNIITKMMQFDAEEAKAFWPLFDQYDAELTKISDGRVNLIVDYARNYENLTDEQADALMSKAFELEAQRAMLKKKYFDKMKTAVSAAEAAKFFLVENQIQHIIDLQISAMLPTVETPPK